MLERKDKAEVLTSLVSNIDGPCTMAVDAAWGAGKTTFLKMWAQYLRNEGFPVVEFNAWETDASGDPFVALTTEITQGLRKWPDRRVKAKLQRIENEAKKWLPRVLPGAIRFASSPLPIVGSEVGHVLGSLATEAMAGYARDQKSAASFKLALRELANSLLEASGNKPTVVLIDELDRCRPTYAIELLETAKHIFGVDHVVFVLAVNREQLAHSVKALYGSEFDAVGYLRRFFDIDFRLPAPDREAFIRTSLELIGVEEFLKNSTDWIARENSGLVAEAFTSFFGRDDLSLRSVGQTIHRFGIVLSSLGNNNGVYLKTLTVLTILSAINPSLCRQFLERETTSEETIESFFGRPNYGELRLTPYGALFEAVIIAARANSSAFRLPIGELKGKHPLLSWYAEIVQGNHTGDSVDSQERQYAGSIYQQCLRFHNGDVRRNEPLGFDETIARLELVSPDLRNPTQDFDTA